ncbi:hypothetical protein ACJIZ3_005916 [Penstemon smallii]|uniref:DUF659 domain-containing protein n=1 Tax=Penstemon smallii TaxID=265156 RepID=A0ABD3S680_9LAMI
MNDNQISSPADLEEENTDTHDDQLTATPLKKYVTMISPKKDNKWICNFGCKAEPYTGSYTHIRVHFLGRAPGQRALGIAECSKVTKDDKEKMRKEEHEAQKVFERSSRKDFSTVVEFHLMLLDLLFFYDMIRGINEAPKGYKPPSADKIRKTLLDKEKSKLDRHLAGIKDQWPMFGISIVLDGWSNIKNQPIINVVEISGGRAKFLNGIDCSGDEKSGIFISELLFKAIIENVGIYNIVQILIDNASAGKLAGEIVMGKYPHIFWSGCMAYSLSLLMKDIATYPHPRLEFIKKVYQQVKGFVKYVKIHSMVLYIFRKFSALEVIQAKKTRFGHHYVVLQRVNRLKNHLISMALSEEWDKIKCGSSSSKLRHQEISSTILDSDFWEQLKLVLKFTKPIWKMIRFCDSDKAVIGEVYQKMEDMPELLNIVHSFALERWKKMNIPLHMLAYVLTPFYYSNTWLTSSNTKSERRKKPNVDSDVQNMYLDVVDRLLGNSVEAARDRVQLADFVSNTDIYICSSSNNVDRDIMPAVKWWTLHGALVPELSNMAIRVLSQSVNFSCAKRVWSTYSFIHSVSRNRMNADHAEAHVYVHYNTSLLTRYKDDYEKSYKDWDAYVEDNALQFNLREIEDREYQSMAALDEEASSCSFENPPHATQEQRQPQEQSQPQRAHCPQVIEDQSTSQTRGTKKARLV